MALDLTGSDQSSGISAIEVEVADHRLCGKNFFNTFKLFSRLGNAEAALHFIDIAIAIVVDSENINLSDRAFLSVERNILENCLIIRFKLFTKRFKMLIMLLEPVYVFIPLRIYYFSWI